MSKLVEFFLTTHALQIIVAIFLVLTLLGLLWLAMNKKSMRLVNAWFLMLFVSGIAIPILALMSIQFWLYLGLGAFIYVLFAFLASFSVIVKLMPDQTGSGALIAPIFFAMMTAVCAILIHVIFQ